MYSTIVVGTDGSATAGLAVERSGKLASLCGASVHLVHGCGSQMAIADPMAGVAVVLTDENIEELEAHLEEQAEALRAEGVDVTVHVATKSGTDAVLGTAEEVGADLIVIGSHGMSGKRRFILGSVPNAVSHHAPCSVLIVHTD
jgi:nucleotide-binding universal stress UspA family protein